MSSFDVPNISFGGLSTGLDTNSIIASLISMQRIPILQLEAQKSGYESKISKFDSLKSYLEELQDAADEPAKGESGQVDDETDKRRVGVAQVDVHVEALGVAHATKQGWSMAAYFPLKTQTPSHDGSGVARRARHRSA